MNKTLKIIRAELKAAQKNACAHLPRGIYEAHAAIYTERALIARAMLLNAQARDSRAEARKWLREALELQRTIDHCEAMQKITEAHNGGTL